jgi:histidine triad (HIT) family protein
MSVSHAPAGYVCPICLGVQGIENADTLMRVSDKVFQDDLVTVFVNSFFLGKNKGHVIVVPNKHYENIYDLPQEYGHRIFDVAQKMANVLKKAYKCDGITTRQNNEPAGDQHAFHFHFHVFPRYKDDGYNQQLPAHKKLADPAERAEFAKKLKAFL